MRSNYKKIGPYIRQVDVRNIEGKKNNLLGVSTQKVFIDSIANTIGTDFKTYKIVKRRQFTYVADTSRRGDRIGIALLETHDEGLVSPIYTVLEITDHDALLPEYLMMWFRRPEFDRYARFMSHGSVRELFDWEEMCNVELPIPPIEKQRKIVREYHTIVDRINLNERLNQKLEETAQAIYKQWFVDFDFPISAEYAVAIGKPELEGQTYKSSGGEMVYDEVLKKMIPKGWTAVPYTKMIELGGGGTPKTEETEFWNGDIPFFTPKDIGCSYYSVATEKHITDLGLKSSSTKLYEKDTVFITARGTVGEVALASKRMAMNQSCYAALMKSHDAQYFVHQHSINALNSLKKEAIGGVFGALVTRDFDGYMVVKPKDEICGKYNKVVKNIYQMILNKQNENLLLDRMKSLLLAGLAKGDT